MHLLKAHRGVQCFLDWPSDDKDLMPKIKPLKNSSKDEMKFNPFPQHFGDLWERDFRKQNPESSFLSSVTSYFGLEN